MKFFVDLFLNLDTVLPAWVGQYGVLIYGMLFLIVFMETGVVVMPFLPGDSLLFAAGAIAAGSKGGLDVWMLLGAVFSAAVLGDLCNYTIGRHWGRRILDSGKVSRVVKPEYIDRTQAFFARHGGKTVSFARFFPFVRTFSPFIAGIGHMQFRRYIFFNVAGAAAWVSLFVGAGYFFGNIPFIAHNLEYLVIGIIAVSVAPALVHAVVDRIRARRRRA